MGMGIGIEINSSRVDSSLTSHRSAMAESSQVHKGSQLTTTEKSEATNPAAVPPQISHVTLPVAQPAKEWKKIGRIASAPATKEEEGIPPAPRQTTSTQASNAGALHR